MRGEAASHARADRAEAQGFAGGAGGPGAPAGAAVQDTEQRAHRHLLAILQPGLDVLEAPDVRADFAPVAALAAPDQDRSAARVKAELGQRQRFLDAQPSPPEDHDQGAHPVAVQVGAGVGHDGDDLFDPGRVCWVALAFVARDAPRW
jgi:hypothetical protein